MRFLLDYFWIFWIIFWHNLRGSAWWGVSKDPSHRFCLAHFHPSNLEDASNLMSIFFYLFPIGWFFCLVYLRPKNLCQINPTEVKKLVPFHRPSQIQLSDGASANVFFLKVMIKIIVFFRMGGVNPLRLPNFLISSVRSIEKVLFSNSWILKVRNPSFISTKSHSLVCNSGAKEDIEDLYMYVCNRIHTVHLLFYGGILQYFLFYGGI